MPAEFPTFVIRSDPAKSTKVNVDRRTFISVEEVFGVDRVMPNLRIAWEREEVEFCLVERVVRCWAAARRTARTPLVDVAMTCGAAWSGIS